jgi:hypothetical protein
MRSGRCAVMYSRSRRRALCRLALAAPGVADVGHDAAQPAGEPVGVAQPVKGDERLQEGVLHGVVGVVRLRAQPGRAGAGHRLVPFDQQPERGRVAVAGQPDQVAVGNVHAPAFTPGFPAAPG